MQPGPKWRSIGHRRQSPFHTGSTLRAANMQPVVTTYKGGNRGQLNLVVFAPSRDIAVQCPAGQWITSPCKFRSRAALHCGQTSGRQSTISSGEPCRDRLWPSWPGFAPPGFDCARRAFLSVDGGFDDVRDVLAGRVKSDCNARYASTSSCLLSFSRSSRFILPQIQKFTHHARGGVSNYEIFAAPLAFATMQLIARK